MKKRLLLAALSITFGLAMFGVPEAHAQIRVGIGIGPRRAYPYRAYVAPRVWVAPRAYVAPRYVVPPPVYGSYPGYGSYWGAPVYPYGVRVVRPYAYAYPRAYFGPRRYYRHPGVVLRIRP